MKQHLYILTGASRGLGLGMARQLLTAGHSLLCIARHRNDELGLLAGSTPQCTLEQWTADLGDGGAAVAARLHDWLVSLDADTYASVTLINNAAVLPRIAPLADASSADIASVLRVGLEAPMQLCAAFLSATRDWRGARRVLNISSGLGRRAMGSQAAYCAAKAGMDHFTRCLALDEARLPNGARVCSLAPGVIDTDMQVQLRGADAAAFPDRGSFEQLQRGGALSSPRDAACRVLAWLDRADFGVNPVADVRDATPA